MLRGARVGFDVLRERDSHARVQFIFRIGANFQRSLDLGFRNGDRWADHQPSQRTHVLSASLRIPGYIQRRRRKRSARHLATIRSAAEETFVYNTFENYGGTDRNLWIGLNDPTHDASGTHASNFKWADGTAVSYTNWDLTNHEPDNGSGIISQEYYTFIWKAHQLYTPARTPNTWNDIQNDPTAGAYGSDPDLGVQNGVVEVATPEPASAMLLAAGGLACLRVRRKRQNV